MANIITFKIHPNNTIVLSVLRPCTADDPYLVIKAPDGTEVKFITGSIRLKDFTTATQAYDVSDPGKETIMTIDQLNTAGSGSNGLLKDSSGNTLSSLPWTSFPPGIYTVYFAPTGNPSSPDSFEFLEFTTILDCMASLINENADCCYKSETSAHRNELLRMMNLRYGAELDYRYGDNSEAISKVSTLDSICKNTDCGCKNCN